MVLDKFSNSIFEICDFEPVPIFRLALLEESLKRPMNFLKLFAQYFTAASRILLNPKPKPKHKRKMNATKIQIIRINFPLIFSCFGLCN
jgi:hypothetical protein